MVSHSPWSSQKETGRDGEQENRSVETEQGRWGNELRYRQTEREGERERTFTSVGQMQLSNDSH